MDLLEGEIEIGMTKNEVTASIGEPYKILHKNRRSYDEVWVYVPHWKFEDKLYFKKGILVKTEPEYLVASKGGKV